ncbi:hypothetical protein [Pseudooceanicola sp. LIPI14-2-Ac024]|uniref:hypothetical protein n=1 Tax=Pseudooceanicola sp. LIPI14-2-Ac024 TaxID=3344875 RepID=UPI0035CF76B9
MPPIRPLRALIACVLLTGLPACLDATAGGEGSLFAVVSTLSRPIGDPLPQAPIAGGEILVKGPEGYCVDGSSLDNRATGGFAMLASCYVMTGGKSGPQVAPVVMTVAASPLDPAVGVPSRDALAGAFAPAPVLARSQVRGVTLVHLGTGGDTRVPQADPRHWRGAMELNGFLVLFAVYGPQNSTEAGKGGSALLLELADALRAAKPAPGPERTAQAPAPRGVLQ